MKQLNKKKRSAGFTLIEVLVGTAMLVMATGFMVRSMVIFLHTESATMAKENLSMMDENIARNLLGNLITFELDATANTSNYCNFSTTPITNYINQTFASNMQLVQVSAANTPPDFPDYGAYTAARARCLTQQTNQVVPGGNFRNNSSFYFCATARGDWQSGGAAGGSAAMAQTVLTEFTFSIRDETNATGLPCNLLGTFPRGAQPNSNSALVAHLLFSVHTVNRSISTRMVASTGQGMAYHHATGALRASLPNSPDFPAMFSDIRLTALNAHNGGRAQPAPNFVNSGGFTDCGAAICSGFQFFSVGPATPAPGVTTVTDIWVQPTAHVAAGLPGLVPPGYSIFGSLADCGDGSPTNKTCAGTMLLAKRVQNWASIPSGGTYVSGLWVTPTGTHSLVGLNCPPGWVLKGFNGDCGGVASGNCTGRQNICVGYAAKP